MSIGRNMAIKANIIIDQGADFSAVIDVKNTNGTVKDLTGFTAAAQMRKNYAQSTPSGTFACTDNNTGGQITISAVCRCRLLLLLLLCLRGKGTNAQYR